MSDRPPGMTVEELRELAERYGLEVNEASIADLADQVNARLGAGLDAVYEHELGRRAADLGDRTWWEPSDDAYNAVSTRCRVPPIEDGSDLLAGMEIGIKDNVAVAGVPMQCGSAVLRGYVPGTDATLVRRLRAAGGEIVAKTNLDEFAVGGRGESSSGPIVNPRDETRSTGGSSGGSAAAVAAGYVDVAIGTDTGGSVRMPAAFCGLVGLKPTYGLVPIDGIVENTYTLDHAGPIADTVEDAARVLEAIAGKDERDPASMQAAGRDAYRIDDCVSAATSPSDPSELRLAVLSGERAERKSEPVSARHDEALDRLEDRGAMVEEVGFDDLEVAVQAKNAISYCELATHWRDGSVPYRRGGTSGSDDHLGIASRLRGSGSETNDFHRSRILAGATLIDRHDGRHYVRAHAVRRSIRRELKSALAEFDAVVTPTVPHLAPKLEDETDPDAIGDDRSVGTGRYTKLANVTGLPAITLPNRGDGPPVGFQLIGHRFREGPLLATAGAVTDLLE